MSRMHDHASARTNVAARVGVRVRASCRASVHALARAATGALLAIALPSAGSALEPAALLRLQDPPPQGQGQQGQQGEKEKGEKTEKGEQGKQEPKPAPKQESKQERRAALQQSMKQRYPDLERMRDAGRIGETFDGFVAVVKAEHADVKVDPKAKNSPTVAQLAAAENDDRKALYALLADGVKPAEVARQNAIRILDRAEAEHWFRLEDGRWVQKKDVHVEKKREGGAAAR